MEQINQVPPLQKLSVGTKFEVVVREIWRNIPLFL
jgi:hypothetical protein